MAVTPDDVKHVAALARLSVSDERAAEFTAQLNTILGHMDVLSRVDVKKLEPVVGIGAGRSPMQEDAGPSVKLEAPIDAIAPATRDGFFLVPRVSSHEASEES
jgi:aspartyl-tRNA(Asn)/glutamyl-tRNA(Gln) amidotransferase subunit C